MPAPIHFKAAFFDLGNTLLYFDADWAGVLAEGTQALAESLRKQGVGVDPAPFGQGFLEALQNYYKQRSTDLTEESTEKVLRDYLSACCLPNPPRPVVRTALNALYGVSQTHWHVEEDALPALAGLREQGLRLGLISNAGDSWDVQALVDKAGLRPYLDLILVSADVGLRKPHPRIFETALDHFGISAAESLMVGDTLNADILGARQIGMPSVWITRRADTPENQTDRAAIRPDAEIYALSELPALLSGWPG